MSEKFRNIYRISTSRLQSWDYSSNGYYFITICAKERKYFFGEIISNVMHLLKIGEIVQKYWLEIPKHFSFVELDEFVIMPNHVHGIVIIKNKNTIYPFVETRHCLVSTTNTTYATNANKKINRFQNQGRHTISSIIGSYKSICTKIINKTQNNKLFRWQPRFYDHIIRDEKSFNRIRQYIKDNPMNWEEDRNNLSNQQSNSN